ncbi:Hypothetical protein FKW44_010952 [Caligus rogercresseyi]|uniref:Uncharacterized protein n=1 Tax=Caligus rogercresseyi TaxID=217165 RepID=A0A7T8HHA8_CALRO|nr:Hypothetical protein FKW44_010952 [Caligus rogercresseyi]
MAALGLDHSLTRRLNMRQLLTTKLEDMLARPRGWRPSEPRHGGWGVAQTCRSSSPQTA